MLRTPQGFALFFWLWCSFMAGMVTCAALIFSVHVSL